MYMAPCKRLLLQRITTILDKIVGTLSNLMIKFHVPCKNVVHSPPPSPLLNVAVGEKTSYMFSSTLIWGERGDGVNECVERTIIW